MIITEKIESLRQTESSEEIEQLLLNGKLGKIRRSNTNYRYIENIQLSWLVVEVHRPGFVEWMKAHQWEYVVHHKDGNILNNVNINLQVMPRGDHVRLHHNDPRFAETERIMKKKISVTMKKNRRWIPKQAPELFKNWFTTMEYAQLSEISYQTAYHRLCTLVVEGQITCENITDSNGQRNVYRNRR